MPRIGCVHSGGRRIAAAALLLCGALIATGCTVTREKPNLIGQDVRVTFIHTSDLHSRLFPYFQVPNRFDQNDGLLPQNAPFGGIARVATRVKEERASAGRSLWLDSGDSFQGAPVFNRFSGEVEVRSLSMAGLDAAVLGNHEFDAGSANVFDQFDNWATFQALAANYEYEPTENPTRRSLEDIVKPYIIFDLDGVLIGVIGMGNWSSMTGIFEGGNSLGLRPIDERDVVRETVPLLRPSVDLVVLLSHLGLEEDEALGTQDVAEEMDEVISPSDLPLAGVDIIFGGHLHIVLDPPREIPSDDFGNKTLLVHSGAFAKYIGRLDAVVRIGDDQSDPERRSKVTAFSYENLPIDATIPSDKDVQEMLEPYAEVLASDLDLTSPFAYVDVAEGQGQILRNSRSGGDSQLGNMVARAMQIRPGVEAEFALTNSLGIRADFQPGPLTAEQMFNVFPFENSITVMFLSGADVQEMLDFVSRRSASRGCRTQAQVSGIYFDMVCASTTCPDGRSACAKNVALGEDCRNGDPDAPVDFAKCARLEPTALYRVAVNDFIARGGSGFEVLERNTFKEDTGISLRDALTTFLRQQKTCGEDIVDVTNPGSETVRERYGAIACLDGAIEASQGRIRPTFED